VSNIIEKLSYAQQAQLQLIRNESEVHTPPTSSIYPPVYPTEPDLPILYNTENVPDELVLHNSVMMSASAPPVDDSPMVIPPPSNIVRTETIRSPQITVSPPVKLEVNQNPMMDEVKYIDFNLSSSSLTSQFNNWKYSLWFSPHGFHEHATIRDISAVLVPHWVYSVDCIVSIKAMVQSENFDPRTREKILDWKEISEQKVSHFDDVMALAVPLDVANYGLLLESSQFWKSTSLHEGLDQDNTGWFDYIKSFISTSDPKQSESMLEYPTLPNDNWKTCFDRHCRKVIEALEVEPTTLFLKKRGYSVFKDLSIRVTDTSNFRKTLYYLPLYICHYQYNNQFFTVMINGKNGSTNGERPYNTMGYLFQAGVYGLQSLGFINTKKS